MKISKHTVPSVSYTLRVEGEIVDQATVEEPLTFLFGIGAMIPGFEKNLAEKEQGDEYDFVLQPEEAYGNYDSNAIVDLPIDTFKIDGKVQDDILKIGNVVPMQDQHGTPLRGIVKEITDANVTMDFNHVLAGKELHFTGSIVEVREATSEEIEHGHVHGPEGHQH